MRGLVRLLCRFHHDERGAFLALFAVMAIVLIATSGAVVDYVSIEQTRTRAQVALDAAALALQPRIYDETNDQLSAKALALLVERIGDPSIETKMTSVQKDTEDGVLYLQASIKVPLHFVALVGVKELTAQVISEASRKHVDIEVAVALDITGSMAGQKIADLRAATKELIDVVVQDEQTPTYSKMALVPYSNAVNVGTYAASVRGNAIGGVAITNIAWTGVSKSITGATKANPVVITSSNHGFASGDWVYISGVGGMSELNGRAYLVSNVSANQFTLSSTNGAGYGNYSSGGTATKCLASGCALVVTAAGHGLANDEYVRITGVNGMADLQDNVNVVEVNTANDDAHKVSQATANTFALAGTEGFRYGAYASGGTSWCLRYGCQYFRFQAADGDMRILPVSTCATERTTNPFNDKAPSVSLLGMHYAPSGNPCPTQKILPLTSNKTTLKALADSLDDGGSTAGHLGVGWAWYMVSPNFGYLWPADSKPAAYGTSTVLKAVVLMTDGDFNTAYCNGVISRDAGSNSGGAGDHINCNATNGNAFNQALAQCNAMKAAGIVLYTVGFDVADLTAAKNIMAQCASDPSHAYIADTGTDLKEAFADIGRNIVALSLSK